MGSSKANAVLVTGAAGFIASHLIESLLERGTHVVGLDNFDAFYSQSAKENNLAALRATAKRTGAEFYFLKKDLKDLNPADASDFHLTSVIHLAAKAGVRPSIQSPEDYVNANVYGTVSLLEFCRARRISDLCFGSSSSVYGNESEVPFKEDAFIDKPVSPYAATKRAGELFCQTYAPLFGMRIAILRFFTVYGPRQRPDLAIHKFTRLLFENKSIVLFGDGSTSRDYTFVTDIVAGILGSLQWLQSAPVGTAEVFNLGGASPIALVDLVKLLEKTTGKIATIEWAERVPGEVDRTFADISKSKRAFGYTPRTSLASGIEAFVHWFRDQGASLKDRAA